MQWLEGLFWSSVGVVFYAYLGYGAIVMLLSPLLARRHWILPIMPSVTLLIAAYDEEAVIEAKLRNCLALDYPRSKLDILVVTDGSSDGTYAIARRFAPQGVRVEHQDERRGKLHALQRVLPLAEGEIIVCTDANTLLNSESLRMMMRHFGDPEVGCVAGEKRIQPGDQDVSAGEGLYWRYESFLKRLDSRMGAVMGAAGELLAFRRACYEPLPPDTILEDFVLSMRLLQQGFRVVYEPAAYARETASRSIADEFKRKARIVAGGWQAVFRLRGLLWPSRPLVTFQYVSHRLLRWLVVPFLLPLLLGLNGFLAYQGGALYRTLLALQGGFYLAAAYGWLVQRGGQRARWYYLPFYFVFMNVAALAGAWRFWTRRQAVTWEKVRRYSTPET
ncbi:glycosyltransferase family 2 protein [bacterium]|nr:glycosyltransferase family 2 protein [bacterium]